MHFHVGLSQGFDRRQCRPGKRHAATVAILGFFQNNQAMRVILFKKHIAPTERHDLAVAHTAGYGGDNHRLKVWIRGQLGGGEQAFEFVRREVANAPVGDLGLLDLGHRRLWQPVPLLHCDIERLGEQSQVAHDSGRGAHFLGRLAKGRCQQFIPILADDRWGDVRQAVHANLLNPPIQLWALGAYLLGLERDQYPVAVFLKHLAHGMALSNCMGHVAPSA